MTSKQIKLFRKKGDKEKKRRMLGSFSGTLQGENVAGFYSLPVALSPAQ